MKTVKMRTLIFTNTEKNILLRLHAHIISKLMTDRIRIWTSGVNTNSKMIIPLVWSFWICGLRPSDVKKLYSKFYFIHNITVKNPKIARQNPQISSGPQISKILEKIPSSGSAVLIPVLLVRRQVSKQYATTLRN